jgi:hypothetical protein
MKLFAVEEEELQRAVVATTVKSRPPVTDPQTDADSDTPNNPGQHGSPTTNSQKKVGQFFGGLDQGHVKERTTATTNRPTKVAKLFDLDDTSNPSNPGMKTITQMETERQQLMLRGAQRTLDNYQSFRAQTDFLMERRTAALHLEFNGPLVVANHEITLLQKRVERRDETIRQLRQTTTQHAALTRQGEVDEVKKRLAGEPTRLQEVILCLTDDCAALQSAVQLQDEELRKVRGRLEKIGERERGLGRTVFKYESMIEEYAKLVGHEKEHW